MRFLIYHLETFVRRTSFTHILPECRWWHSGSPTQVYQVLSKKSAGLFRPTGSKSANITQHFKKLHVEHRTKVKKKKQASWAERISIKHGKPNWAKFGLGCKGKPEGFGFVYCICPLGLLILGEDFFWWAFGFSIISEKTYNLKYTHISMESSLY